MARVKFSALISDISGSIGGSTLQKNAYGSSIRNKPFPINVNNHSTNNSKLNIQEAQRIWRYMNDEQRSNYDKFSQFHPCYSKFNKSSLLSGYNLFMKYALICLSAKTVPQTTIQFNIPTISFNQPTLVRSGLNLIFDCNVSPSLGDYHVLVKLSRNHYRNEFIPNNQLRVIDHTSNVGTGFYIQDGFAAVYNTLPGIGDWCLCSVTIVAGNCPVIYPSWVGLVEVTL